MSELSKALRAEHPSDSSKGLACVECCCSFPCVAQRAADEIDALEARTTRARAEAFEAGQRLMREAAARLFRKSFTERNYAANIRALPIARSEGGGDG